MIHNKYHQTGNRSKDIPKLYGIYVCLLLVTVFGFTSCISDDSEYGSENSIPTLKVTGEDADNMLVYNFNLGETVTITPEINYSGDASKLVYNWKVGTYTNNVKGVLEDAGNEKQLTYNFEKGGVYYAHLTVSDGQVGRAVDYQININRTFEQGYVLVSNDSQGNGNLAFVSIPAEAGQKPVVMEHCIERMNEGVTVKNLIGLAVKSITWPSNITRVFVEMEDKAYCIDANTFTILNELDYSEVYPGFKAKKSCVDSSAPYVYDPSMKKFVHFNVQYSFPYEYHYYVGQAYDDFIWSQYLRWGRTYDNYLYVDYQKPSVSIFYAYAPYFGYDSPFVSSGDMLAGQKILSTFSGTEYGDCCPTYVITQLPDGKTLRLYSNTENMFPTEEYFTSEDLTPVGDEAIPEQGTRFYGSPTYKRHFYAVGDRLYAFLTESSFALPKKNQYIYDFGGEVVTAMNINITTEQLYVATQTTATGRGNFYIFNCSDLRTDNQGKVKPVEEYKDCADKITEIVYKPRVN